MHYLLLPPSQTIFTGGIDFSYSFPTRFFELLIPNNLWVKRMSTTESENSNKAAHSCFLLDFRFLNCALYPEFFYHVKNYDIFVHLLRSSNP